nr:MAG TPA: hypothetical protein [Caudoviricetes sp.]
MCYNTNCNHERDVLDVSCDGAYRVKSAIKV